MIQSPSQDILQETPQIFFEINPQSRTDALRVFCKKNLTFSENRPVLHKPSHYFFAKTSSDFSQINIQSNFDYIFFSQKKTFGQCTARMGAPERLVNQDLCLSV